MAAARLIAELDMPIEQTELPLSEQSSKLENYQRKVSEPKAEESVHEDFLAVKKSLETGQLSKLLIEVRTVFYSLRFCIKGYPTQTTHYGSTFSFRMPHG